MSRKKLLSIIICGALFVLLLIAFFAIQPLLEKKTPEADPPELLDGEVLGNNNRIYMFPAVTRADMEKIEVHNEHGTYTFYRAKDNQFYIEGKEFSPYSLELFSQLVVSSGTTLTLRRIEVSDEALDLSEYGLAPEDDPAYYILTKVNGDKHKVWIGDQIPTEGGYYCRYDGRDAVYVMDSTLGYTLLADIYSYLTPSLGYPVSSTDYYNVDDMIVIKDGELLIMLDRLTPEENGTADTDEAKYSYEFIKPEGYTPNLNNYSVLLELLASFAGTEVVAAGEDLGEDPETFLRETYGIKFFSYGEDEDGEESAFEDMIKDCPFFFSYKVGEETTFIFFSKPDEEGNLYAFSTVYWQVVKLNVKTATFLNWDLLDYIDPPLFFENIKDVSSVAIKGEINNADETLAVDEKFYIKEDENGNQIIWPEGESNYDADTVSYFKKLYQIILSLRLEDYADMTDISQMSHLASMTITMDNETVLQYEFYAYSTRRCFYTINGEGKFWVSRDHVEKVIRNTDRLVNGLPVDAGSRD